VEAVSVEQSGRWRTVTFALPTYHLTQQETGITARLPQHSASTLDSSLRTTEPTTAPVSALVLETWLVQGIALTAAEALPFLNSLPLSSVTAGESVGTDLRYWSHVARWSLDLLARSKFLPTLGVAGQIGIGAWQALVDSATDQSRLNQFVKQMPPACRTYRLNLSSPTPNSPPAAQTLLFDFLNHTIDAQVRAIALAQALPSGSFPKDIPLREWLQTLGSAETFQSDSENLQRLQVILSTWTAPLERQLTQPFNSVRTCFVLNTPEAGQKHWALSYFLQATDAPNVLISASAVWNQPVAHWHYQGRIIEQPQETLLAGLGLASRLYPVIEPSLNQQHPQFCILDPMQVYEFIKSAAWRLQESGFGVVLPPSLANQSSLANRMGLSIRAETPLRQQNQRLGLQSLLNFQWELTIGGQRLSKTEFDRLAALNTPLVEINGEWVELRPQDVKAAQAFFQSRKDQVSLSLEDALRISTGDTQVIEKLPVVSFAASGALEELITALTTGNQSIESIATPHHFQGELRPYQVRGASWLAFLERWGLGACLADDMGLGKTIQLIAFLLHLQEQNVLEKPVLLVCPTSVLGNWEREVKRFGPSLNLLIHHGDKRAQGRAFAAAVKHKHLIITSYALVYRDEAELKSVSWQGLVLDEAQNIKNSEAKQSQAVRQLEAEFRIALTGTPVENRLAELWSIMDFLNPGYLGPRNFFQRRFAIPIERYGDTASLKTLRSLVQPFILRRLKTDRSIIQDLPEKQEITTFCGLSSEQATLYQRLVEQSLVAIESAEGIQRKGMILALLTKLKQICNHPDLYDPTAEEVETAPATKRKRTKSPAASASSPSLFLHRSGKLQRLSEMLEEMLSEGDRCLIFTQFAEWGKLLKPHLETHFGREVLFLYGSTPQKQREEMVDRFQNDPQGPRIFILSLKAGGVGLNLTRANHVFHFDRWWNPAVENQATDRVFRIGQTRNVQVHKFVCSGTLEERIHELIESKKALSEQVVGAGENWLTDLDTAQLRNLLLLDRAAIIDD
jgi:SNF2 family DNA or RNA helicase